MPNGSSPLSEQTRLCVGIAPMRLRPAALHAAARNELGWHHGLSSLAAGGFFAFNLSMKKGEIPYGKRIIRHSIDRNAYDRQLYRRAAQLHEIAARAQLLLYGG